MTHPYNRGQPRRAIESEMDRFEREISSIAAPGQGPPPRNSFIPAQLRRPVPPPPPAPPGTVPVSMSRPPLSLVPGLRPSPIIISGAPQVYSANSKLFKPTTVTSVSAGPRPTVGKFKEGISSVQSVVGKVQEGGVPHGKQEDTSGVVVSSNSNSTGPSDGPGSSLAGGPGSSQAQAVPLSADVSKPSSSNSESPEKKKKKKKKKLEGVEKKPRKALRSAGGQIWEDQTLQDWDPSDFRLFCGDLGNDVTDEVLTRVFGRYPSFQKAKVVRDKRSNKTKGFGFVSFKDPNDFVRAIKELDGRYVGSRPIKLRKSNWRNRNLDQARKKEKERTQILAQMKKT